MIAADLGGRITRMAVWRGRMRVRMGTRKYLLTQGYGVQEEVGHRPGVLQQLPRAPVWRASPPTRVCLRSVRPSTCRASRAATRAPTRPPPTSGRSRSRATRPSRPRRERPHPREHHALDGPLVRPGHLPRSRRGRRHQPLRELVVRRGPRRDHRADGAPPPPRVRTSDARWCASRGASTAASTGRRCCIEQTRSSPSRRGVLTRCAAPGRVGPQRARADDPRGSLGSAPP